MKSVINSGLKEGLNVIAWIVVGIVIGWMTRPIFYPTLASAVYNSADSVNSGASAVELAFSGSGNANDGGAYPISGAASEAVSGRASRMTGSVSSPSMSSILQLIEQQKVKQTLDALQRNDLYLSDHDDLRLVFQNNLHQLLGQKNWQILKLWVQEFLGAGYTNSILYSMDASIKRHQGDLLAAMHALFLAKHYSETEGSSVDVQADIENLVIDMMNQYRDNSSGISRQVALSVMQIATEKQPENPLFGLEISVLYADAGDANLAIETLNFIPYSEKYQDAIVALKARLLSELNNTEQVTTAIPLKQVGHHFHVTAIINQERTLDLLIDTGATTTALDRGTISLLKAVDILGEKEGSVAISTANGAAEVDYYRANLFAIGEFAVENFELLGVEMSASESFDGLLGMNFLSLFEFEIDQTNRQLFLTPKAH